MDDHALGYETRGMEEFAGSLAGSRCIRGWMRGWVEGRTLVRLLIFLTRSETSSDLSGRAHGSCGRHCRFHSHIIDCHPRQRAGNERVHLDATERNDTSSWTRIHRYPHLTRGFWSTRLALSSPPSSEYISPSLRPPLNLVSGSTPASLPHRPTKLETPPVDSQPPSYPPVNSIH